MTRFAVTARRFLTCVLACTASAAALYPASESGAEQRLETVMVTGSQPGPGLWQIVKGDHRMWVVATLTPIPRDVEWLTDDVRAKVLESQAVLSAPGLKMDTGIGLFRAAFLAPSLLKARRNPDNARLQDVLPPDLYERWSELKAQYLPRNRRIERWRPIAAVSELREAAAKSAGLVFRDPVSRVVAKAAQDAGITLVSPTLVVEVDIDKPRQRLKALSRTTLDDHDCFRQTLDAIDSDVRLQRERANAWAVGDLETLRELSRMEPTASCLRAALDSAAFDDLDIDFDSLLARVRDRWLSEAERLLAEHETSFAILSIDQVLQADGLLALLAKRGYAIVAPDDEPSEDVAGLLPSQDATPIRPGVERDSNPR